MFRTMACILETMLSVGITRTKAGLLSSVLLAGTGKEGRGYYCLTVNSLMVETVRLSSGKGLH